MLQYGFSHEATVSLLNANSQLIKCTHITDLLSNLKGLLDFMIIKVLIVMQNI